MKEKDKERFPACVPWDYRLFARVRKISRQVSVRSFEAKARKQMPSGVLPDGPAIWSQKSLEASANPPGAINKGFFWIDEDLASLELKVLAGRIEALKKELSSRELRFTNTAATFLPRMFYPRSEHTKTWESVWTIHHSRVQKGHRVLDVGGASTPFSFYLASLGCSVSVLDNDWNNCGTIYNANFVARAMNWDLKALDGDIGNKFPFGDNYFDRIFSICTIEHLSSPVRQHMMKEVGRTLKPGGIAAITMCYDRNHKVLTVDKGLRFGYREKFDKDVLKPSGLQIYGNTDLTDYDGHGFLGAIFLEKK